MRRRWIETIEVFTQTPPGDGCNSEGTVFAVTAQEDLCRGWCLSEPFDLVLAQDRMVPDAVRHSRRPCGQMPRKCAINSDAHANFARIDFDNVSSDRANECARRRDRRRHDPCLKTRDRGRDEDALAAPNLGVAAGRSGWERERKRGGKAIPHIDMRSAIQALSTSAAHLWLRRSRGHRLCRAGYRSQAGRKDAEARAESAWPYRWPRPARHRRAKLR